MVQQLHVRQFLERRGCGTPITLIDVREHWETVVAPVPCEHLHMPMAQIADRLSELDPAKDTVVICHSGVRSLQVASFLEGRGFRSVYNLSGGIRAWSHEVDPTIPNY